MKNIRYIILAVCILMTASACAPDKTQDGNTSMSSYSGTVVSKDQAENAAADLPHAKSLTDELTGSKNFMEAASHKNAVIIYNGEVVTSKKVADTFLKEVESNQDTQLLIYNFNDYNQTKNVMCMALEVKDNEKNVYYRNPLQDSAHSDQWNSDLADGDGKYKISSMSLSKYGVLATQIDGNSELSYTQVISNYDIFDDYDKKLELANKYATPIYYPLAVSHTFNHASEIVDWLPILERIFEATKENKDDSFWTKYPDGHISVDEMMGLINRYFDVEKETVVGKIKDNMIDQNTVEYLGGLGGAYPSIIVTAYEENEDTTQITCTHRSIVTGEVAEDVSFIITVKNMPDGTFRYQSLKTAPLNVSVFQKGSDDSSKKTMKQGDSIGDWTLDKLNIQYDQENNISRLNAYFKGDVTLKGKITRSVFVEYGYDFTVGDEDKEKMPCYVSDETNKDNVAMFMLEIPENLENAPKLEFNEELECSITISDYHFTFAYMMAPSGAIVTKIEIN